MTTEDFIHKANFAFHPIKVSNFQRVLWIALGLLLVVLTLGIVPAIFYSVFFSRTEYLNRKKMYQLLKKSPYLLSEHIKTSSGYVWPIDLITQICWIKEGIFCTTIKNPVGDLSLADFDEIVFCTHLQDKVQKRYDRELKKILKASLPKKTKSAIAK